MNQLKELLDREAYRIEAGPDALESMLRRRDRKRRNQRIAAGVVGIAVFVAAVWIVTSGLLFHYRGTPAAPSDSPTIQPTPTASIQPTPRPTPLMGSREMDYLLDVKTGETTPLPEDIRGDWHNGYAVSPDGSEVAYYGPWEGGGHGLFVARIDGMQVRQIADGAVSPGEGGRGPSDLGPGWSPDGTKIAYVGHSRDVTSQVFVVNLTNGVTTQVTFESVDVSGTQFSPDGSSIVYTAYPPRGSEVRIAPATGGEGLTLVGGHGSSASGASFSPDGSLLSYICADPAFDSSVPVMITNRDLCLANADGSDPRVIAEPETPNGVGGIMTASWSPNGSRLAFGTFDGVEGVYILDLATGQTTCVAGCGVGGWPPQVWPRWLDDHTLFVEAYNGPH